MFLFVQKAYPESYAEKMLLACVLRRAAFDIANYRGSKRLKDKKLWNDAHRWMFGTLEWFGDMPGNSEDWEDEFMSFSNVCRLLNVHPTVIRQKTLRLTKKDVKKYDMVDPYGRI